VQTKKWIQTAVSKGREGVILKQGGKEGHHLELQIKMGRGKNTEIKKSIRAAKADFQ